MRSLGSEDRLSAGSVKAPILARFDSGSDSAALIAGIEQCNQPGLSWVDFLIQWNPRATDVCALGTRWGADGSTQWRVPHEGKRLSTWEDSVQIARIVRPVRRVLRLTERTVNAQGQLLGVPDFELAGWTTSLPEGRFSSAYVIALYADHGTHGQFHAEFKTDLDLTRLPSGKFDINCLVRQAAKRRRLKTVIQALIYQAGRLISTGRQLILGLGANDRSAKAFARLHGELFAAST